MTRFDGEFVVVPATALALLALVGDVRRLRARNASNPHPVITDFLADLDSVAEEFAIRRARVTEGRESAAPVASSVPLTVKEAAVDMQKTESAIRRAIREGRLRARRVGSQYSIEPSALAEYRSNRGRGARTPHTPPG